MYRSMSYKCSIIYSDSTEKFSSQRASFLYSFDKAKTDFIYVYMPGKTAIVSTLAFLFN